MVTFIARRILVLLVATLIGFSFTVGEVMIVPENHLAEAARKKRKSRSKRKKREEVKQEKKAGDEMDEILKGKKDDGLIPIEELMVADDIALTSSVGRKIDESINKLLTILKRFQEPGTLRRLAEFYWKKSNRMNLDFMQAHQKKMDVWFSAGQKGEPPKEPDSEVWFKYNRMAVKICNIIIERFPKFQGMDEVYFFMGYNLNETGRDAEAVQYYKKLVREHPNSSYIADSWMTIGDYYFSHNNVYDALPAYEEVLKFEASKVFGYAKYKIGWCYFNLGKYKDAIETFKEVVAWSQDEKKKGRSQITLMEEALKDLVMSFAEDGSVDEAEAYFKSIGGMKYFRMMLVRLADIYTNQGKLDDSIVIYKRLIRDYPLHKQNPDFQLKIVEAYSNKNDKENTTKEILNMVYYAKPPEESEWVEANYKKEPELIQEAWENAERMLIKTVVEYHKEALKVNNQATWDKAEKLYEMYIQYFKKSKTFYDVSFNYAELLYRRASFKKAGEWYTKVAEMDSKGKHFEEASYSAILSYEKLVHKEIKAWIGDTKKRSQRRDKNYKLATTKEEEAKEEAQRQKYEQRELSENVQGFVKACNIYIDHIPKSKYKVDIIYKVAIIYYAHNLFDNAVNRFDLIVKDYPTHRLAEYSANLILDSLNIKQRWRRLNETVRGYLKNRRLVRRAAFRKDLRVLLEKSSFKKVELTEREGKWREAADEYMAFAKEFRRSNTRDKALFNASVHYVKAGDLEESIKVQKKFLKEHKKSAVAHTILFNLGKNYEALAYYGEAADRYEEYDKKYPKGKHQKDALYNAAVFHENLGHTEKAVKLKRKYMDVTKDKAEKDRLDFGFAFMYLDVKDYKSAERQFKAYLKKREKDITWPKYDRKTKELLKRGEIEGDVNRIYIAHIQLKKLYTDQGRKSEVEASRSTILRLAECDSKKTLGEAAREAIAEAHFYRLEDEFKEYAAFKLEVRRRMAKDKWNKKLAEKLKKKSEFVIKMQRAYEEVIKLKSPQWSVAALFQIGQVYKYFSLAMFNSEIPYWLTMDQQVIYVDAIQQRAVPIERKALDAFEKCLLTAYKTGAYNKYTIKAREELQGYMPKIYKAANEIRFTPGYESDSMYLGSFVTPDVPDIEERRAPVPGAPGVDGEIEPAAEKAEAAATGMEG